jgi:hypothetical protein
MALRESLIEKGVLREDNGTLIFCSDYTFSSVSAAAAAVIGASANGRTLWHLPDGRTYAEWEGEENADTSASPQMPEIETSITVAPLGSYLTGLCWLELAYGGVCGGNARPVVGGIRRGQGSDAAAVQTPERC